MTFDYHWMDEVVKIKFKLCISGICVTKIKYSLVTITIAMTIGLVLYSVAKVIADLSGYLHLYRLAFFPCYWYTHLSRNLV